MGDVRIALVGNLVIDVIFVVDNYPEPGRDAFAKHYENQLGGIATSACALARLGASPRVLSMSGDDMWGRYLLQELQRERVDVNFVSVHRERPTHIACVVVTPGGERTIVGNAGASQLAPTTWNLSASVSQVDAMGVSGYAFYHREPVLEVRKALCEARRRGVSTALDVPKDPPLEALKWMLDVTPWINVLIVQPDDLLAMCALPGAPRTPSSLLGAGPTAIVQKLGKGGCSLTTTEVNKNIRPPIVRTTVDSTGAGDVFFAGVLAGLGRDLDLVDTLWLANALAGLSLLAVGGSSSAPGRTELVQAIDHDFPQHEAEIGRRILQRLTS